MFRQVAKRIVLACSLIIVSGLLTSCSILPDDEETLAPLSIKEPKVEYNLYKATKKDIQQVFKGSGVLLSARNADLYYTESGGRIKTINASIRQKVKKGDILMTVDSSDIEENIQLQKNTVDMIQIQLDNQNDLLKKYMSLPDDYRPAQKDIDDLSINAKLKQKELENAKITLKGFEEKYDRTILRAPFDGIVTFIEDIKTGDLVDAFKNLITISDPTTLQVYYQPVMDAREGSDATYEMKNLKVGMTAEITYREKQYKGKVLMTPDNTPKDASEKLQGAVLINIDKLPDNAVPGDGAQFSVTIQSKSNVLVVPSQAVRYNYNDKVVQVMEDGKKKLVTVETGIETTLEVEVLSGLSEGQMVILD
ncbi:MAG: efflux RND transporter periplasmic adaptor subunit [Bacillota bacterium]|nr:efflux RND transporter periplasmic adaptor subunit [Bacillota bacterium]